MRPPPTLAGAKTIEDVNKFLNQIQLYLQDIQRELPVVKSGKAVGVLTATWTTVVLNVLGIYGPGSFVVYSSVNLAGYRDITMLAIDSVSAVTNSILIAANLQVRVFGGNLQVWQNSGATQTVTWLLEQRTKF